MRLFGPAAALACALALPGAGALAADEGASLDGAARALDDPAWAVRRGAARALEAEGRAALEALPGAEGPAAEAARARLERWVSVLERCRREGSPEVAATASGV